MKTISEIYEEYKIFPMLQDHMLRVAGVASVICDSLDLPIEKNKMIIACLLHDMGNIVKADLGYFSSFAQEEIEYWEEVKKEYIEKYGASEHEVNTKISKEIGLSDEMLKIIDQNRFALICKHRGEEDIFVKILHYADARVGPFGVLSYEGRMDEAKERYKNRSEFAEENRLKLVACGKEIERQIFAHSKIKPEDINDETVKSIISELRNFVIK